MNSLEFLAGLAALIFVCGWKAHGAWVAWRKAVKRRSVECLFLKPR
jgi:hypothetical protein